MGVPVIVQWKLIQLGTMRLRVQSLASLSELKDPALRERWCGFANGSDPMLLWFWCRPAAVAPIRPLTWGPPHAMGVALKKGKK